jgi:hypothetical protein
MPIILYQPNLAPVTISEEKLSPFSASDYVIMPDSVSELLGCDTVLVDVLFNSIDCIIYSVFDSEGEINYNAMAPLASITGVVFDNNQEDNLIRGNVLIHYLK